MNFCVISPIAGLDRYSRLSKSHLVLQHVDDDRYTDFYIQRGKEGDLIILDNGAYEGVAFNPVLMHDCIELYKPQVVVLPDFMLGNWEDSMQLSFGMMHYLRGEFEGQVEFMFVPQAEPGKLDEFCKALLNALDDPRITWIGLPRCLATDIAKDPLARVNIAKLIKREKPNMKIHALGMVNGDYHELPYLEEAGVDSIDSNAPVWRGWKLVKLRDSCGQPFPFDCDFNDAWPEKQIYDDTILANLELCNVRSNT